jgi:hypothetical protein
MPSFATVRSWERDHRGGMSYEGTGEPSGRVPSSSGLSFTVILTYAIAAINSLGSPPSGSLIRAIDSKVK